MSRPRKIADARLDATAEAATLDLHTLVESLEVSASARSIGFTIYNAGSAAAELRMAATDAGLGPNWIFPGDTLELPEVFWPLDEDRYLLDAAEGADLLIGVWERLP